MLEGETGAGLGAAAGRGAGAPWGGLLWNPGIAVIGRGAGVAAAGRRELVVGAAPMAPGDQSVFLGSGAGEGTLELLMLTIRLLVHEMTEPRKCGRHYRPREFRTWGSNPESTQTAGLSDFGHGQTRYPGEKAQHFVRALSVTVRIVRVLGCSNFPT